ncbi:MAG: hypothetical protein ABS75_05415 [Pelagibacterium sp. SCN 63-23]|nr:MAG: hypothetical protein ABS75_05415 [Pelagibacterium sp. SCN 63-23]
MDLEPDLFGVRPASVEHRTYFALFPSPAQSARIEDGARRLGRRYNVHHVVHASRIHISLNGLKRGAELAPEQMQEALEVGAAVRRPAFDLLFDRIQSWDGGRSGGGRRLVPTVLCCSEPPREAAALYDDLRRVMQALGLHVGARTFNPHVTLWYAPTRLPPRNLARPLRFRVDRFCLAHTIVGSDRAEHLASWPLKF